MPDALATSANHQLAAVTPPRQKTAFQRLCKNRIAVSAFVALVFVALFSVVGPVFLQGPAYRQPSAIQLSPPIWSHPFGTDINGRDVLYNVMIGGRISLLVGIAGALISFFIGTTYGLISGYVGGRLDGFMMRLVEILYSIPSLIFIIVFVSAFDSTLKKWMVSHGMISLTGYSTIVILIVCLGLMEWLTMARIVRGQVLSLKEQQFVAAARSLGQSHTKIITRHLLPNLISIVIVYLTLTIPAVILDESFLSFLGLGIQAPQSSWGTMLADGAKEINPIHSNWWMLIFPAVAMSLTLLALNFLGDAFRDALDPRQRR